MALRIRMESKVLTLRLSTYADCVVISDSTETGMARLSLTDSDKDVREWFIESAKAIGCHTYVDQMGNLFAIRPGKNKDAPPIMMGSHLDTQPTGGRYDGILGVVAGLEVLKVLEENSFETEGSIGVVDWTKYVSSTNRPNNWLIPYLTVKKEHDSR